MPSQPFYTGDLPFYVYATASAGASIDEVECALNASLQSLVDEKPSTLVVQQIRAGDDQLAQQTASCSAMASAWRDQPRPRAHAHALLQLHGENVLVIAEIQTFAYQRGGRPGTFLQHVHLAQHVERLLGRCSQGYLTVVVEQQQPISHSQVVGHAETSLFP